MENSLDVLLNKLVDRQYKRFQTVYRKRINIARDKEFAISQFVKRVMAFSEFRIKLNDGYRSLMEALEEDYRMGRPILYTINKLRKYHQKRLNTDEQEDRSGIITESGLDLELPIEVTITDRYSDINILSDEQIIHLFAEYLVYDKFTVFLVEESKPYLTKETDNVVNTNEVDKNDKTNEFTTARQVIAIHYLLSYCQVKNIDNTEKARFIRFLTGKNFDNIYKRVQSPLNGSDKYISEDLKYIRGYFERLGMKEIVKMINNELDQV